LVILQSVPFVVAGYRPDFNGVVKRLNAGLRNLTNGAQVRFFDLKPPWLMVRFSTRATRTTDCTLTGGAISSGR
jgi:hypothetical protein